MLKRINFKKNLLPLCTFIKTINSFRGARCLSCKSVKGLSSVNNSQFFGFKLLVNISVSFMFFNILHKNKLTAFKNLRLLIYFILKKSPAVRCFWGCRNSRNCSVVWIVRQALISPPVCGASTRPR